MESDSSSQSVSNPVKVTQDEEEQEDAVAFEWTGRWQHILFFVSYIMNFDAALSILESGTKKSQSSLKQHSECLQLIILTIFIGGPILLFQTSLGQYTRRSCLFLGEMFPLAYGLGYSMLLMSFYSLTSQVFYTSKLFYYTIITLCNAKPPWMKCYAAYYKQFPGCISKSDMDKCTAGNKGNKPCFPVGNSTLSAYIFKEAVSYARIDIGDKSSKFQRFKEENYFVVIFCLINGVIIFISLKAAVTKSMKDFYTALRSGIILCVVLLMAILVVVFTQPGTLVGLQDIISTGFHLKLPVLDAWIIALGKLVKTLRLAEGGHILFGSFIPRSKADIWRSALLAGAYTFLVLAATIYYHLFLGQLMFKLNMNVGLLIQGNEENIIFVLFPTSLGILPSSYFFCLIYFIVLSMLSFFSLAVKVIVLEMSITKHFGLHSYYLYIRFAVCGMATLFSLAYEVNVIFYALSGNEVIFNTFSVALVTLQLIILFLYGVSRFSDDIEYITRTKVKKFIRTTWIISLIKLGYCSYAYIRRISFEFHIWAKIAFISLVSLPLFIVLIFKAFAFAKRKNIVGLLRATNTYGPPEIHERIMRVLYNPRLAVRFKRPEEICNHKCLLNSKAMTIAITEELSQIRHFMDELKLEAGHIAMEESIREQFKKHVKCVLRAVAKRES